MLKSSLFTTGIQRERLKQSPNATQWETANGKAHVYAQVWSLSEFSMKCLILKKEEFGILVVFLFLVK